MSLQPNLNSLIEKAREYQVALACAFILIVVIYVIAHWNTGVQEDYLYGFWVAEGDAFCEEAEIDSLLMYLGEYKNGSRECYIVIMDDVTNQAFKLTYSRSASGPGVSTYRVRALAEFDETDIWGDGDGKTYVDVAVDMRDGTIRITNGDKLLVRARKQHEVTEAAKYLDE